jgi:hypothetical protein
LSPSSSIVRHPSLFCQHHRPSQFDPTSINFSSTPINIHPSDPFHPLMSVHCWSSSSTHHILKIICISILYSSNHMYVFIFYFFKNLYMILKNTCIYVFLY